MKASTQLLCSLAGLGNLQHILPIPVDKGDGA